MAKEKSLRLYHKHRLDYIRTGSPRSFRLMTNHWDSEFFTQIPAPVGKRHRDTNIVFLPYDSPLHVTARLNHVHLPSGRCVKNRYGPRCN